MSISNFDISIALKWTYRCGYIGNRYVHIDFRYIHSYKMDISMWIYRKSISISISIYPDRYVHFIAMDISIMDISMMTSSNVSISDMSISIYRISDIPVFLPAPFINGGGIVIEKHLLREFYQQ